MSSPVRIAIVNDYELVVAGIAAILAPYRDRVEVVELDSQMAVASPVDVVLYDSFGALQGLSMRLGALVETGSPRVAVFSWNVSEDLVHAVDNGAAAYISKNVTAEQLVDALERIHAGESLVPSTSPRADVEGEQFGEWPGKGFGLTAREAEVLALLCQGLSNQEICGRVYITTNSLKTYIRRLYPKIGAKSRTQAVLWGVDHGFRPDRTRRLDR